MVVRELNANKQIEPPTLLHLPHPRLSEINEGILSPSFTIHKIRPAILQTWRLLKRYLEQRMWSSGTWQRRSRRTTCDSPLARSVFRYKRRCIRNFAWMLNVSVLLFFFNPSSHCRAKMGRSDSTRKLKIIIHDLFEWCVAKLKYSCQNHCI